MNTVKDSKEFERIVSLSPKDEVIVWDEAQPYAEMPTGKSALGIKLAGLFEIHQRIQKLEADIETIKKFMDNITPMFGNIHKEIQELKEKYEKDFTPVASRAEREYDFHQ